MPVAWGYLFDEELLEAGLLRTRDRLSLMAPRADECELSHVGVCCPARRS